MTTGHFIARLQLALHRYEYFDHFHHARREIITTANFFDLIFKAGIQGAFLRFILFIQRFNDLGIALFFHCELPPMAAGCLIQQLSAHKTALGAFWTFHSLAAFDHRPQTCIDVAIQDGQLIVTVARQTLNFFTLDLQSTFIFFNAMAIEHTHFHDCAIVTRWQTQRGVAHVRGLLPKDRPQELFLWCHRAFAFWCDFTNQDIRWTHFRTDIHDARFVQIAQSLFANVRNITGDFLRAKFGVARGHFKFFDVNRGEHVIAHNTL